MKRISGIIAAFLVVVSAASFGGGYDFRAATEIDMLFAKAATDWLFHDDWGRPRPSGAYSGWGFDQIPALRSHLVSRGQPIPVDIILSRTNAFALLNYQPASRVFRVRASEPEPWPSHRLIIRYWTSPNGSCGFWLSWDDNYKFELSAKEANGKVTIQEIKNVVII